MLNMAVVHFNYLSLFLIIYSLLHIFLISNKTPFNTIASPPSVGFVPCCPGINGSLTVDGASENKNEWKPGIALEP